MARGAEFRCPLPATRMEEDQASHKLAMLSLIAHWATAC